MDSTRYLRVSTRYRSSGGKLSDTGIYIRYYITGPYLYASIDSTSISQYRGTKFSTLAHPSTTAVYTAVVVTSVFRHLFRMETSKTVITS